MFLRVQVIAPPLQPVVSVALVRQHSRIDSTYDDNLLAFYIDSATNLVGSYLNRSLVTRTIQMTWSDTSPSAWHGYSGYGSALALPIGWQYLVGGWTDRAINLVYGSVQSVQSVSYRGINDDVDTVLVGSNTTDPASTITVLPDYRVDLTNDPARIRFYNQGSYGCGLISHYSATYTAGYGDPSTVPTPIIHAILLTSARAFEHRGDDSGEEMLSRAARSLLDPYRLSYFGN